MLFRSRRTIARGARPVEVDIVQVEKREMNHEMCASLMQFDASYSCIALTLPLPVPIEPQGVEARPVVQ